MNFHPLLFTITCTCLRETHMSCLMANVHNILGKILFFFSHFLLSCTSVNVLKVSVMHSLIPNTFKAIFLPLVPCVIQLSKTCNTKAKHAKTAQ